MANAQLFMLQRDRDVEEFVALTKCSKKIAQQFLSNNNWALDYALNEDVYKRQPPGQGVQYLGHQK